MAGYKRGSMPWYQMSIGMFTNISKKIHEKAPQCDDNLKELIRLFAEYAADDIPEKTSGEELRNTMIKKIFDEN